MNVNIVVNQTGPSNVLTVTKENLYQPRKWEKSYP